MEIVYIVVRQGRYSRRMKLLALLALATACAAQHRISEGELVARSQTLLDAVTAGDKRPWQEMYAPDAIIFDEKGRLMDKKALVADIEPLPKGYSGAIKLVRPKSHIESDVAILSYDSDETEEVFGQHLSARYHTTDTWLYRDGRWQIAASQVLRYYEDPAEGPADVARYPEYAGTYALAPGLRATVSVADGKLYLERPPRAKVELVPEAAGLFFVRGAEGRRLFRKGPDGSVDAMIARRNNEDIVWRKIPTKP
ncbi:MAG TPA: DUF4440 domain-containing protein [Myxococcales bacterium]